MAPAAAVAFSILFAVPYAGGSTLLAVLLGLAALWCCPAWRLADVFAYAAAQGVWLRVDSTEVQVRRPRAGRPGRRVFVSGKKKQNTIKATAISDGQGRLLWLGAFRPGRMHDVTTYS